MIPIKFTRLSGFGRGKTETFTVNPVRLGTDAVCELRFDAAWDKTVSAHHAEVRYEKGGWWLVDASRDGTLVSGQKISRQKLDSGSVLELGKGGPTVKLEWDAAVPDSNPGQPARLVESPLVSKTAEPPPAVATIPRNITPAWIYGAAAGLFVILAAFAIYWQTQHGPADEMLPAMAERNAQAMGLIVVVPRSTGDSAPQPLATAFAVGRHEFATTAQAARAVAAALTNGGAAYVAINGSSTLRLKVLSAAPHPRYGVRELNFEGKAPVVSANDVGLLITEEVVAKVWPLGSRSTLEKIEAGQRVGSLNFPVNGGVEVRAPVATLHTGIVSAFTDMWTVATADASRRQLVRNDLATAGSAEGAPLFNAAGEVIAIMGEGGFAQRVDLLREIWPEYPR